MGRRGSQGTKPPGDATCIGPGVCTRPDRCRGCAQSEGAGAPGQSTERVVPRGVVWGGKHKDDVVPGDENSGVFLILGLKRQEEEGQDVTRTAGQSPCLERAA